MGGSENMENENMGEEIKINPCPKCGRKVEVHGGDFDWKPTFYDPDSGGIWTPCIIRCECGVEFSSRCYDAIEFIETWNRWAEQWGETE